MTMNNRKKNILKGFVTPQIEQNLKEKIDSAANDITKHVEGMSPEMVEKILEFSEQQEKVEAASKKGIGAFSKEIRKLKQIKREMEIIAKRDELAKKKEDSEDEREDTQN